MLFRSENLPNWIKKGKKTVDQKLIEKALEILKTHKPEPLARTVKGKLDAIWTEAEKKIRR